VVDLRERFSHEVPARSHQSKVGQVSVQYDKKNVETSDKLFVAPRQRRQNVDVFLDHVLTVSYVVV
jgi:hypothetical protein